MDKEYVTLVGNFYSYLNRYLVRNGMELLTKGEYYQRRLEFEQKARSKRLSFLIGDLVQSSTIASKEKLEKIRDELDSKFLDVLDQNFPDDGFSRMLIPRVKNYFGFQVISDLPSISNLSKILENFGDSRDLIKETVMGDCDLTDLANLDSGYSEFQILSDDLNGRLTLYDSISKDGLDYLLLRFKLN